MPNGDDMLHDKASSDQGVDDVDRRRVFYTLTDGLDADVPDVRVLQQVAVRSSKMIALLAKQLVEGAVLSEEQLDEDLLDLIR